MKKSKQNNLIEELFSGLSVPLYRFVFNILKNTHDAEDIVSDTFIRALEIVYVKGEIPDVPLLYTIARNMSIDFLRRRKRISYDDVILDTVDNADKIDVFEEVNRLEQSREVESLIKELPEIYASVFYLRFMQDLPFAEISGITGIEESSARVIYHRAKNKLKKMLDSKKEIVK